MSENDHQVPTWEIPDTSSNQILEKETSQQQSRSSSNNKDESGGCAGVTLGFLGGFVALIAMFHVYLHKSAWNISKNAYTIIAIMLPFCVLYLAKRKNYLSFFLGVLIPYIIPVMLLLLIYGICG